MAVLRRKLLMTISMFCLTIVMLMVGVWAVKSDEIKFGGTITFTATNILATITGGVQGAEEDVTFTPLEYTSAGGPGSGLSTWSQNINFNEDGDPFTITMQVVNNSSRSIFITITDLAESHALISKNITYTDGTSTNAEYELGNPYELKGTGTKTVEFKITVSISNTDSSTSGAYNYNVDLKDESVK